jgi:hypothetical protein
LEPLVFNPQFRVGPVSRIVLFERCVARGANLSGSFPVKGQAEAEAYKNSE